MMKPLQYPSFELGYRFRPGRNDHQEIKNGKVMFKYIYNDNHYH